MSPLDWHCRVVCYLCVEVAFVQKAIAAVVAHRWMELVLREEKISASPNLCVFTIQDVRPTFVYNPTPMNR